MSLENFIFRCPLTLLNVQGSVAKGSYEGQHYVAQHCPACGSVHMVNPLTGGLPQRAPSTADPIQDGKPIKR